MASVFFIVFLLCLSTGLIAGLLLQRRHAVLREQALQAALDAQRAGVRLLRLTAADLRAPALALQSLAEQAGNARDATLMAFSRRLLDLAEGLLDQTEQPDAPRPLTDETLELGPLLGFVVAQISSQLGPGQRAWHISGDLDRVRLRADRRAVHQVLLRVITAAALATRDSDWIDIKPAIQASGWALVVEDEGTGLPVETMAGSGPESRGIGVGLTLARRLMQAHGGTLTIESVAKVGTRTVLWFPAARLITDSPAHA